MTDTLNAAEIKKRSIKGAKWLLLMNGLGLPVGLLVALLLGRVGPAALGVYALAQILTGVVTTFIVYGGPTVLPVFMAQIPTARDRGRFLFSYALILGAAMGVVLVLFLLFPRGFAFLLQREFDMRNYGWFALLAMVIVGAEMLSSAASGLMLINVTAIARQMTRTVLLPVVAFLFFFHRELLAEHGMPIILGGFFAGYLASAVICAIGLAHEPRFQMRSGWLIPRGFWTFSLSTMMATIFTFLYNNFDRMAVLSIQDVKGLGIYQAVISLSLLIGLVPQMLGTSLVPMFSSLLATGNTDAVRRAYAFLQRVGSVLMTLSALFLISFSRELLSLFGEAYPAFAFLLSLFSIQYVITSLHFGNTPLLTAFQKNAFRLGVSSLQIFIQVACTLLFLKAYGVLAIAGAKMLGVVCANAVSIYYVTNWIGEGFRVPRSYKIGVGATLACMIARNFALPAGWGVSAAVFVSSSALFCIAAGITTEEVGRIAVWILPRSLRTKA